MTNQKETLIRRLRNIETFGVFPSSLDWYLRIHGNTSISLLQSLIEKSKKVKISQLEALLENDQLPHLRALCKKFNVKGYSRLSKVSMEAILTNEIKKKINCIEELSRQVFDS
jgi:hypothetical protein